MVFCNYCSKPQPRVCQETLLYTTIIDNKLFRKFLKPQFSDESSAFSKIALVKNDLILSKDEDIAFMICCFFPNVESDSNIPQYEHLTIDIDQFDDPSIRAKEKYKNHPSTRDIKENSKDKQFTLGCISKSEVKNEKILNLDRIKAI